MTDTQPLPADAPIGLRDAISDLAATVRRVEREARRTYLWLEGPSGRLFARYSSDPVDVAVFAHEVAARTAVRGGDAIRAPEIVRTGETWLLEQWIDSQPLRGAAAIDLVVRAAIELEALDIPAAPEPPAEHALARWIRRLRLLSSPRVALEVRRVRRLPPGAPLPTVSAHGDFHPNNLLVDGTAVHVVDWELAHPRPAGHDLMQLWASLADAADRARVFEAAVRHVGEGHRSTLARLRYTLLVQTIAAKIATALDASRDRSGARRLLRLLPEARRAARRGAS